MTEAELLTGSMITGRSLIEVAWELQYWNMEEAGCLQSPMFSGEDPASGPGLAVHLDPDILGRQVRVTNH